MVELGNGRYTKIVIITFIADVFRFFNLNDLGQKIHNFTSRYYYKIDY